MNIVKLNASAVDARGPRHLPPSVESMSKLYLHFNLLDPPVGLVLATRIPREMPGKIKNSLDNVP